MSWRYLDSDMQQYIEVSSYWNEVLKPVWDCTQFDRHDDTRGELNITSLEETICHNREQ